MSDNSFDARAELEVGDRTYEIYRLDALQASHDVARLPFSLKILLENLLRNEDGTAVRKQDIETLVGWDHRAEPSQEIAFTPARVVMQDFTGVPAVVDLAAMRDAMSDLGGDPAKINPLVPAELVIDHSVQVDVFGTRDAFRINAEKEFERNRERYAFLRWGQGAFDGFVVVPPDTGIVHQVNLEYPARVVFESDGVLYPDTLVGTDSHTTMINGLGLDAADAPAEHAEAVDHRRVRVGPDQRVRVQRAVGLEHHAREVLEVDLVDDPRVGRHDLEALECALTPAQERVALLVALELALGVDAERVARAEHVDLHRVVDDELGRQLWVDPGRVAPEVGHRIPHPRQIDDRWNAGEVLEQNAGRPKRDLVRGRGRRLPAPQCLGVLVLAVPQGVLEQDPQRVGEPLGALQPEDLVALAAGVEGGGAHPTDCMERPAVHI